LLAFLAAISPAGAEQRTLLRVGVSGDYPPFSFAAEGSTTEFQGFDLAAARAYAADRNRALELVRFRWPELLSDLAANRFDVAMSGITIRPERSIAGIFTVPVMASGAVVLVREDAGFADLASLDGGDARIAVNRGGHLERVARAHFPRATILAIPDNAAVREALLSAKADAAVTDTLEAPIWLAGTEGVLQLGPFTRDQKAYLVHPDRGDLAADLNTWLIAREGDGTLAALRRQHLGHGDSPRTADPVSALLAAVGERLDLMPLVAEAKRESGTPVTVPEREVRVIDAALAATHAAARDAGLTPVSDRAVRAFFEAQITAAKEIQRAILKGPAGQAPTADLDTALRPALSRIGERIAFLLPRLPARIDRRALEERGRERLRTPGLSDGARDALVEAVLALCEARGAWLSLPAPRADAAGHGRGRAPAPASLDPRIRTA
jgi:cyclohexadienyl dehydratase